MSDKLIAIIDYGMGNLASVEKALKALGKACSVTNDINEIQNARGLILPGVGSFRQAMENLRNRKLIDVLNEQVLIKKKPFLGICLGMQLIASYGTEDGDCEGLGWIPGHVVRIEDNDRRIPHLGWNEIQYSENPIFQNLPDRNFYFIHSYHFVPDHKEVIIAQVPYGKDLVAGVQQDNIIAFQFHPEKSQAAGLKLLSNYFEMVAC